MAVEAHPHAACDWAAAAVLWSVALEGATMYLQGLPLCSLRGPAVGSCALRAGVHCLADLRVCYSAVLAAASTLGAVGSEAAMRALLPAQTLAELAAFMVLARRRMCADDGLLIASRMQASAQAAD